MDEFPDAGQDHIIDDLIVHIRQCADEIEKISLDKQDSEKRLRELLNHSPTIDGSKSYPHKKYSIKITTGYNHTLNKKNYEEYREMINPKFNPVKEVTKYELNKKTIRDCQQYGDENDRWALSQFITSSDKKLHITIENKDEKNNKRNSNDDVVSELSDPPF